MLNFNDFILNSKAYGVTSKDISSSRISHAYMLVSPDENFLLAFAEKFACDLICASGNESAEKTALRISKRVHPDVIFVGENEKIDVSFANKFIEDSLFRPFEADKKIFILLNSEQLSEIVQNVTLKTIEEPPKDTYFIMCAKNVSKFLPTILSRVKLIELDTFPEDVVENMLIQNGISKEKAQIYASCSNGNATFAEKLALDSQFTDFFESVINCLYEINGSRDVLKYSSLFSSKDFDKNEFFDIFSLFLRDVSMILAGKSQFVVCKNVINKLKLVSSSLSLSAVTELIELCFESKKALLFNANSTAVVDEFLFKLAEVKVKCRRLLG